MDNLFDPFEFLKADILCLLHDYGEMTSAEIDSALNAGLIDIENALFELVTEEQVKETAENKYITINEIAVKRLKKNLPTVF